MKTKLIALPALFLAGCITVNLNFNFPQKELQEKLFEQEKAVRAGEAPETPPMSGENPMASGPGDAGTRNSVFLQDKPDIEIDTPETRALREKRKKRWPKLEPNFAAFRLGEGKDARVSVRDESELQGREKAEFRKLVKEENEDRDRLIEEVAKANKYEGEEALERVRLAFAQALKRSAGKDWWIQSTRGKWVKKTEEHQKILDKGEDVDDAEDKEK